MKKSILTISAIALSIAGAMAQPNFSFESWTNVFGSTTIQDPTGWASLNTLVAFGGTQSVFKETTAPFAGTASAKIVTIKVSGGSIPNPYRPGTNLDTTGFLVVGTINISPPGIKYGCSYASRPAVLSFQSKYSPTAGDSAFVLVYMTKWTGSSRDTVATGKYVTGLSTTAYSLTNLTLTYNPIYASVLPDSEQIFISSSIYSHAGAKIGSTLYIDDLAWSGYNSTNDIKGFENNVTVYPNPAGSNINITCSAEAGMVELTDITGRLVGSYLMIDNKANIQTAAFAPGMYIFNVLDKSKKVINRGRFEISK